MLPRALCREKTRPTYVRRYRADGSKAQNRGPVELRRSAGRKVAHLAEGPSKTVAGGYDEIHPPPSPNGNPGCASLMLIEEISTAHTSEPCPCAAPARHRQLALAQRRSKNTWREKPSGKARHGARPWKDASLAAGLVLQAKACRPNRRLDAVGLRFLSLSSEAAEFAENLTGHTGSCRACH